MPAMFILNPYANRWRAGQCKDEALATLPAAGVQTGAPAHPTPRPRTELAYQAAIGGFSPIIAAADPSLVAEDGSALDLLGARDL